MATRKQFQMSVDQRQNRRFSMGFRKQKVKELESGQTTVSQLCKQYEVSSTSVYRWKHKFGYMKGKKEKLIIESESDTRALLDLKRQVAELERMLGQKQIELEFKDKMIDIAEREYGVDIKKKYSSRRSLKSGSTGKNTPLA